MPPDTAFVLFDHGPTGDPALFATPKSVIRADTAAQVPAALEAIQAAHAQGDWLAGLASYELGYLFSSKLTDLLPEQGDTPLLEFGVFDSPMPGAAKLVEALQQAPEVTLSPRRSPSGRWRPIKTPLTS